ncbi:MAG: retropepsin-like domain-containing protein [Candidatus Pacearchaeota archaeon]|nr:retropepsin-like domain-containing protein [Candidatus Pacearchaeota archaeon]
MPSVTTKSENLEKEGPVLEVHFLISLELEKKYLEEGKDIPPPIVVKALIDTGATSCVIQDDIPKKLGLKPIGEVKTSTPSCKGNSCYQYFMRMSIPSHNLIYSGPFIAMPLKGQDISCLIGRDVLKESILIYIGAENQFTLSLL